MKNQLRMSGIKTTEEQHTASSQLIGFILRQTMNCAPKLDRRTDG